MTRLFAATLIVVASWSSPARAQGIPTFDGISFGALVQQLISWAQQYGQMDTQLAQQVQEIANQGTQIAHQITQIQHLVNTYNSMTGSRALGEVLNLVAPTGVVDPEILQTLRTATNALQIAERARAMFGNSQATAVQRAQQIASLMRMINTTVDPKSVQEIMARIGIEQAATAADANQIAIAQAQVQSERERLYNEWRGRTDIRAMSAGRPMLLWSAGR